jgi:hypothetical protein
MLRGLNLNQKLGMLTTADEGEQIYHILIPTFTPSVHVVEIKEVIAANKKWQYIKT